MYAREDSRCRRTVEDTFVEASGSTLEAVGAVVVSYAVGCTQVIPTVLDQFRKRGPDLQLFRYRTAYKAYYKTTAKRGEVNGNRNSKVV
jgi:hypothetical protein